jgi:hypothetical protein
VTAAADLLEQGRLEDASAYLDLADRIAPAAASDRQRKLEVTLAVMKLSMARRHGDFESALGDR